MENALFSVPARWFPPRFGLKTSAFPAQFAFRILPKPLFFARRLKRQGNLLAAFVEALQHIAGFGPTRAAAGGRLDHLQTRLGLIFSRHAFLPDGVEPRLILAQLGQ